MGLASLSEPGPRYQHSEHTLALDFLSKMGIVCLDDVGTPSHSRRHEFHGVNVKSVFKPVN